MNLDRVTDSHVKLDILDDMQDCLNNNHHRIALEYDEDTLSLVVDPTLSTSDISVSDNSDFSTGNASAFEYECYEVKDDTPWFNYHGPKIKIPKQESPVTICTAETIGTIRSQRLIEYFLIQAQISLWSRDHPYQTASSQSYLVIPNLWEPSWDVLRCKKLSRCKTSDCQSSIRTGASTNKRY